MTAEETHDKKASRARLNFRVDEELDQRLNDLKNLVRASSKSEVVRDAIQLYEYLAEAQRDGWRFSLTKPDGTVESPRFFLYPRPQPPTSE